MKLDHHTEEEELQVADKEESIKSPWTTAWTCASYHNDDNSHLQTTDRWPSRRLVLTTLTHSLSTHTAYYRTSRAVHWQTVVCSPLTVPPKPTERAVRAASATRINIAPTIRRPLTYAAKPVGRTNYSADSGNWQSSRQCQQPGRDGRIVAGTVFTALGKAPS